MCKQIWVGVDLAKHSFHAALAPVDAHPSQWARLPNRSFGNSPKGVTALCAWVAESGYGREQIAGVCVEATGRLSWTFAETLEERLGPVSIVNPAHPVQFARSVGLREKTDRTDACVLALFGIALRPVPRPLPTKRQHQLRELARLYSQVRSDLTAVNNQLGERIHSTFVRKRLQLKRRRLEQEIDAIEQEMDTLLAQDPQAVQDAQRMQTIPGVGPKTARTLLAHLGDLRHYTRAELTARAGLYPRKYQSGSSVNRRPRLAKGGGAAIRTALYMAALNARRFCPHLRAFAERLKATGLKNMAILGAVMRKLLLLIRRLIVTQSNYNPQFATQNP
jgi:transposase